MSKKKSIWFVVAGILLALAVVDAIRYLKPNAGQKQQVLQQNSFPASAAKEIILVHNAWGGIYPGIADFVHKEFFPASYPCNLCYQTFGTFRMKKEWKQFLDSLPLKKTELHKDGYQQNYKPENLSLPVILVSNGKEVQILLSAKAINRTHTLEELKTAVIRQLKQ